MLAQKHPICFDTDVVFEAAWHRYTVRGKRVSISVTALGKRAIPPEFRFDGQSVISRQLQNWRSNASSKYHAAVEGVDDAQAAKNVLAIWDHNRNAGTEMHKCIEQFLNNEPVVKESEFAVEMAQFHEAMNDSSFSDLMPYRTELSIFANDKHGDACVAGQIDFLMTDTDGGLHMIDFKRSATDLTPNAPSYGKTFLDELPLNDFFKYSLQLAIYKEIFELQTNKKILSTRLLQIHPDLEKACIIPTEDMRTHARTLLRDAGVEC